MDVHSPFLFNHSDTLVWVWVRLTQVLIERSCLRSNCVAHRSKDWVFKLTGARIENSRICTWNWESSPALQMSTWNFVVSDYLITLVYNCLSLYACSHLLEGYRKLVVWATWASRVVSSLGYPHYNKFNPLLLDHKKTEEREQRPPRRKRYPIEGLNKAKAQRKQGDDHLKTITRPKTEELDIGPKADPSYKKQLKPDVLLMWS